MTAKKELKENSAVNIKLDTKEKALKLRESLKRKRPDFVRQESWRYKRIKENWRRPRGLDNKMRRKVKGWPKCPEIGYRGPKVVRGLHPSGYEEVLVYNPNDLDKIDPEKQAVRIAHTVGIRKRMEIIAKATSKKIKILNPKEAELELEEERLEAVEKEELEEKKAKTEETEKKKAEKKKEAKTAKRKGSKKKGEEE